MNRFILRFRGPGSKPAEDLERIHSQKNVNVIDESSPRMLLVEAPESELKTLINSMPGWVMSREQTIPLPDPRPKLRRGGKKDSTRS
jgi:hypothetical protein